MKPSRPAGSARSASFSRNHTYTQLITGARSFHAGTSTQARRLHAAGQHPYRRVALSRRMAGHEFQHRAYALLHPGAGAREVRCLLHGRPHGGAEHAGRGPEAQPHGHVVRAVYAAFGALAGDGKHRPGGDRLDHVRRALSHRAALRLARPSERRTRRLEHRHHVESGCRTQFRHGRPDGARRTLRTRARVLRCRDRLVGFMGGRCLHPRRRRRHLPRSRQDARARSQGRVSLGARAAQHRAPHSGLAGHRAGRRVGGRQAACLRDRGSGVHRRERHGGRTRVLRRREGSHGKTRPPARAHEDPAGLLRGGGRNRRGGAREARAARRSRQLRERRRIALDRARPRCFELRSRRSAARNPGEQPEQERPRARDRAGEARGPHGAPARAAARRVSRVWR